MTNTNRKYLFNKCSKKCTSWYKAFWRRFIQEGIFKSLICLLNTFSTRCFSSNNELDSQQFKNLPCLR